MIPPADPDDRFRQGEEIHSYHPYGILNELFSNALRHAFPKGRAGEIVLDILEEQDVIIIRFTDNGIGLLDGYDWENADSVGFILVISLVQQLQGTISHEPGTGTRFLIRLLRAPGDSGAMTGTYNRVPSNSI